jgi:hypothetical protein
MPFISIIRGGGIKVKSFDKEEDGNNHFPIGKQAKKVIGGGQGGFYLQEDLLPMLHSRVGGINHSRAKTNQNLKISR